MPRAYSDTLIKPKQVKRGTRYGTWNIRSLYGSGWLTRMARKLSRYKTDPVGVHEVRWDKKCTKRRRLYFVTEKKTKIINWEQVFLYVTKYYQQLRGWSFLTIGYHM